MVDSSPPRRKFRLPRIENPRTRALVWRDTIWQIGLPIGLALAAGITLGVLVSIPGGAAVRGAWSDVALVFLIVPTALLGIVILALVVGLVVAAYYGLRELPYLFHFVQHYAELANSGVKRGAEKASGVIVSVRSFTAGVDQAVKDTRKFLGLGG